jgi:hypothetical protein
MIDRLRFDVLGLGFTFKGSGIRAKDSPFKLDLSIGSLNFNPKP